MLVDTDTLPELVSAPTLQMKLQWTRPRPKWVPLAAIGMWLMWLVDAYTGEAICNGVDTHGTAIPKRTR